MIKLWLQFLGSILLISMIFLIAIAKIDERYPPSAEAAVPLPYVDCSTTRGKAGVITKGYDGKRYRVDVCAVAESADGEEFRFAE